MISITHCSDVIMMAMEITGVSIVCSAVSSDADQRKHQSYAAMAIVRGHRCFPSQKASNTEKFPIWWRHRDVMSPPYLFTNLCHIASGQEFQVILQTAVVEHWLVSALHIWLAEQNVVPQGEILDPSLLWYVGSSALQLHRKLAQYSFQIWCCHGVNFVVTSSTGGCRHND